MPKVQVFNTIIKKLYYILNIIQIINVKIGKTLVLRLLPSHFNFLGELHTSFFFLATYNFYLFGSKLSEQ